MAPVFSTGYLHETNYFGTILNVVITSLLHYYLFPNCAALAMVPEKKNEEVLHFAYMNGHFLDDTLVHITPSKRVVQNRYYFFLYMPILDHAACV